MFWNSLYQKAHSVQNSDKKKIAIVIGIILIGILIFFVGISHTCDEGHFLNGDSVCDLKTCTCDNGTGATGTKCPTNGVANCTSCNSGYKLEISHCKLVDCRFLATDIVFMLDGSSSMNSKWQSQIDFFVSLTQVLRIGPSKTNIGAVQFGANSEIEFNFTSSKKFVKTELNSMTHEEGGSTKIVKGLESAHKMFREHGRSNARKIIVAVTDNDGYSADDVIAASNDFKADGGKILMIVIDQSTQQTHTELASNDKSGNQLLWNGDLNKLDEIRKVVEETIGSVYQSGCLI